MSMCWEYFILFSAILIVKGASFSCPDGFDQLANEDVCVLGVNQSVFYLTAISYCASKGGIPVKIQNAFENLYLQSLIKFEVNDQAPYIGIQRNEQNEWIYADGTMATYLSWAQGEPNTTKSNVCTIMDPGSGKWKAVECTDPRPFYCSFDNFAFQCPDGWIYLNETDYCYYLQNFTYSDGIHWNLFSFSMAEGNCRRMNSHLVSIHNTIEDDFVYEMIYSNVVNETNPAPNNNHPCDLQWAWTGLIGSGEVGDGTWTDGSPVDYIGIRLYGRAPSYNQWVMSNDKPCWGRTWDNTGPDYGYARFVCKQPSAKRIRREKNGSNARETKLINALLI